MRIVLLLLCIQVFLRCEAQDTSIYKKYYGTVGNYPVVMDLLIIDTVVSGTYHYLSARIPIPLSGRFSNGKITMSEKSMGRTTGTFEGALGKNGGFTGIWMKNTKDKSLPFKFTEGYSNGAIKLEVDVVSVRHKYAGSEYSLDYSYMVIGPKGNADKKMEAGINTALHNDFTPDFDRAREFRIAMADTKKYSFEREIKEAVNNNSAPGYSPMNNHYFSTRAEVLMNDHYILTIAELHESFTGGAHGFYGTENYTFDTRTGKRLKLDKAFIAGYEAKLASRVEQLIRETYELKPSDPLTEMGLYEDKLVLNENFYVKEDGIGFTYMPYEIAPYAVGQIEAFIPFSELISLIDPKGPLAWAIKK